MSNRQTIIAAVILACVAAAVVWWLEQFNRRLLEARMQEWLDSLPTYRAEQ